MPDETVNLRPFVALALAVALAGCATPAATTAAPGAAQTVQVTVTQTALPAVTVTDTETAAASGDSSACTTALADSEAIFKEWADIVHDESYLVASILDAGATQDDIDTISELTARVKAITSDKVPSYFADKATCLGGWSAIRHFTYLQASAKLDSTAATLEKHPRK